MGSDRQPERLQCASSELSRAVSIDHQSGNFSKNLPLRSSVHCELKKLTSRLWPLPLLFGLRLAADLAWSDGISATPQAVLILSARKDDIGRVASRRRGADCVSTQTYAEVLATIDHRER